MKRRQKEWHGVKKKWLLELALLKLYYQSPDYICVIINIKDKDNLFRDILMRLQIDHFLSK